MPKQINPSITNTSPTGLLLTPNKKALLLRKQLTLKAQELTHQPSLAQLPSSTRRLKPMEDFLGQERAKAAIETALKLPFDGYNIFAAGTNGLGKRTMITRMLTSIAQSMPTPSDWVYVNNFEDQRKPYCIEFPAGEGIKFKKHMHALWDSILQLLEKRFTTNSYYSRIENIRQHASKIQQLALNELTLQGQALELRLVSRNEQHFFVPIRIEGSDTQRTEKELDQTALAALSNAQRNKIAHNVQLMEKKLERLGIKLGRVEEQTRDEVAKLNNQIATDIITPKITQTIQRFEHVSHVENYLKAYTADIISHVEAILEQDDDDFLPGIFDRVPTRYQVNVVVSHKPFSGAPIIYEDLPTYFNLVGHIEQQTQMGTITTDFTLIRGGAFHSANGGFLLLEAEQLLEQPYAWHGLKRALRSGKLKLSSLEQMLTLTGNISLEPHAIPLSIKVILLGDASLYYEMLELEPEFNSIFKIRADFADTVPRTKDNENAYLRLIADYVAKRKLLPLDKHALAALLTDASRQAEDQNALSLHASTLGDLLTETSVTAHATGADIITAEHITHTLDARRYRLGYLRELYWHDLSRGTQLIETTGFRVGQINALTVVHYADTEFGMPARLTASVSQGGGDILDIERTVELGGALHAKGILIMSSFLRSHFGRSQPLHFSAALAFEQSYGEIDGDSATLAELSALISAISQTPIDQSWAITGSMNQLGQVQPIGGINAKIEGFFDTCQLHGLTGTQGVIFPAQNKQHLMLRADVIAAVKQGQFHLCAIRTVDEALAILTGHVAGAMDAKGQYPKNTIYAKITQQIEKWKRLEDGSVEDKPNRKKPTQPPVKPNKTDVGGEA